MTITQKPSPNFDSNRVKIDRILIHWIVGNLATADAQFAKPNGTSAHYGIEDETVHQYVKEENVAYHAGNYPFNQRSIGIEHSAAPDRPASPTTYLTSGLLVSQIAKRYNIPLDREHIMKHSQVVPTQCCGTVDIDKIIAIAKGIDSGQMPVDPMLQKKASRYDVIEHDDKGQNIDTNKITDAEFEQTRATFKNRKEGNGKWGQTCDLAGVPHSSTPQQVADKFKSMGGCSPAQLSKAKEEGRKQGRQEIKDIVKGLA